MDGKTLIHRGSIEEGSALDGIDVLTAGGGDAGDNRDFDAGRHARQAVECFTCEFGFAHAVREPGAHADSNLMIQKVS